MASCYAADVHDCDRTRAGIRAGTLAQRLRISPLVGYLLAGVVVGPFTPGYIADQNLANELAEVGVILLYGASFVIMGENEIAREMIAQTAARAGATASPA